VLVLVFVLVLVNLRPAQPALRLSLAAIPAIPWRESTV
jgi:hypothetical protein